MSDVPLGWLFGVLGILILLSAFFSGSETGMMAINRYRLRHLVKQGNRSARRVERLLRRPDRLIGVILLGNNFVNILASSVATLIALRLLGESGIAIAAILLTLVILIFAEVAPKTVAALSPDRIALPASHVHAVLLFVLYPFVWMVNTVANGMLRLVGVDLSGGTATDLSREELRTVVNESGALIPRRHQRMLLNILDLENARVEDIMIPRAEVVGLDLEDDWNDVLEALVNAQYTRLPVYRGGIDHIEGLIHVRSALPALYNHSLDPEGLQKLLQEPYFVPEATPLQTQIMHFQQEQRRVGLVVDEYGDIQGLITLEDILEEIIGEFTTDVAEQVRGVFPQEDGSYLVNANLSIRELNRSMRWQLPTGEARTLNGLVTEYLETIPEPGTTVKLNGYPIEIVKTTGATIKTVKIFPRLTDHPAPENEPGSKP